MTRHATSSGSGRRPPVVIVGGGSNAVSIARSLGGRGIKVYAVNRPWAEVRYSRFAEWVPLDAGRHYQEAWTDYLTSSRSDALRGSVLLAASDVGIQIVARHRERLERRFLLDESNPEAQLRLLDKLTTYRAASAAGIAAPRFWAAESLGELEALRESLVYPLLVKPKLSHAFTDRFTGKFLTVSDFDQLRAGCRTLLEAGVSFVLVELIPGSDDRLCSYYTYLDEHARPQFHFTKRVIRRYPVNMGMGCYHITDWNPEVRDLSLRLFQSVRLLGLANAEFKRDARDGQLKLIECNARFTEANALVERSGLDLARFVYDRIVGLPTPPLDAYREGVRLWYPLNDFRAFRQLNRRGELTVRQWLSSLGHRKTWPLFRWHDPGPSVGVALRRLGSLLPGRRDRRAVYRRTPATSSAP